MLSFIIVNYNSELPLKRCLQSISKNVAGFDYEIIVVNNDRKPIWHLEKDFGIKVIQTEKNIGFGPACNKGASFSQKKYLFFLNPDTVVNSKNISSIIDLFEKDVSLGIVGTGLLTEKLEPQQWSAGKETGILDIVLNNFGLPPSKKIWQSSSMIVADWVSGASLIVRKQDFLDLNGFDEKFFMYFEDMDLCRRIRLKNKEVVFFPLFEIIHVGGESFSDKKTQKKNYYQSQDYYFQKHLGILSSLILKLLRKFHI
ncbi:MAG: hypothetical protein ACD_11C00116G0017 [uncultured bacterium]|nr:MAG: hypothetical protein ACD_11C00116G0017 [uncultured bacterium]HBR71238.1 hypothetical protein [Candidatus Moranbacteria bacterium]